MKLPTDPSAKHGRTAWWPLVAVLAAALLAALPLTLYGFPRGGFDARYHAAWHVAFTAQFWQGEPWPRWLLAMNAGLGSPSFFYYPPFAHWVAALASPLGPGDGWSALALAAALLLALSGLAAYAFLRDLLPPWPAVVGAVAYMVQPHHYAIDLYARAAFAEFAAFLWPPLLMLAARRLALGGRLAGPGLALAYAGLACTHLPTTLLVSPVVPLYALFAAPRDARMAALGRCVMAMALGAVLAAPYLAPALATQHHVSTANLWEIPFFDWRRWFLFAPDVPATVARFHLLLSLVVVHASVVMLLAFLVIRRARSPLPPGEALFWLAIGLGATLMMTHASWPLWAFLPFLGKVQWPFRLITVQALPVALLIAALAATAPTDRLARLGRLAVFLALALWLAPTLQQIEVRARSLPDEALLPIDHAGLLDQPEYYPAASRDRLIGFQTNPIYPGARPGHGDRLTPPPERALLLEGAAGSARVLAWEPRRIGIEVDTPARAVLQVAQLHYPGWTARLPDGTHLPVGATPGQGLLSVALPAGTHHLTLTLESPAERAGTAVGLAALALLAGWAVRARWLRGAGPP